MKCFLLMGRLLIKVSENERQFEKKKSKTDLNKSRWSCSATTFAILTN